VHKRATHKDAAATKARHFLSRYSYVSTRIHPETDHQCCYLAGQDCGIAVDSVLFGANGRCEECGKWTSRLEVHHIQHKTKMSRCWCPENLIALCVQCHRGSRGKHVQVRFGEYKEKSNA
jgi:5-methylcytosine-specific restriction endonuclease McrA